MRCLWHISCSNSVPELLDTHTLYGRVLYVAAVLRKRATISGWDVSVAAGRYTRTAQFS